MIIDLDLVDGILTNIGCFVDQCDEGVMRSWWAQKCYVQVVNQCNVSKSVNVNIMHTMKIFLTSNYLAFFRQISYHKLLQKKSLNIGVNLKVDVNVTLALNTLAMCTCHVTAWS